MNRNVLILDQLARNVLMTFPPVARWRLRRERTAPLAERIDEAYLERYAYEPFELIERTIGVDALEGRTIAEVGPGDHIPVGLMALGAGARQYVSYDRFDGKIDGPSARRFYAALFESLADRRPECRRRLQALGIEPWRFPDSAGPLVRRVVGPIEEVDAPPRPLLDLLFSYNVVEHLLDPARFAAVTFSLIRPGGMAIHKVDLGPHDVWLERPDPFEWLVPTDRIWRWMGSHRGTPNRLRYHEVRDLLLGAGFEVDARVVESYDTAVVSRVRPGLAARFREAPLDSLAVKTAIVLCRKPMRVG